jgi:hypothetical protein
MFLGPLDQDPFFRGTDPDPFLVSERCLSNKILTQNFSKELNFLRLKMMCLCVSYKKKKKKNFSCILKVVEVRSRIWRWIRIRIH